MENRFIEYHEFPPPESLASHVQCAWVLRDATPGNSARTIFPDGRCELIAHLGTPPRSWDAAEGWHSQASTLFAAQRVIAVRLEATGPVHCVGVRLQPAAGAAVMPGAAKLRDRIVDLAKLDARLSREFATAARSFAAGSAAALWKLLARHAARRVDPRIAAAVTRIEAGAGRVRIDALARSAALSPRGFQAKFRAAVGLTPKEFARLTRLQATLRALDSGESSIAAVASDAGFADQAHVTRELRRTTGLTPAKLRAELRRDPESDVAVRLAAAFVRGFAG
jgi:methylphosphotriester-DNA--protein-cysteine methyltransferase